MQGLVSETLQASAHKGGAGVCARRRCVTQERLAVVEKIGRHLVVLSEPEFARSALRACEMSRRAVAALPMSNSRFKRTAPTPAPQSDSGGIAWCGAAA